MAERPIFIPVLNHDQPWVRTVMISFQWHAGFSSTQKRKNIQSLHAAAAKQGYAPLLEVSSKSEIRLGRRLSAFNLMIETSIGKMSIESAFQGSKVFELGGPYTDLYHKSSVVAKQDPRLKHSGRLIGFNFMGDHWDLEPKTAFYDWLYIQALYPYREYIKNNLSPYQGFTDIEFNPKKSVNCQARSCALLMALIASDMLDEAMASKRAFIDLINTHQAEQKNLLVS